MPEPLSLAKAHLHEIRLPDGARTTSEITSTEATLEVPFNPETLKVTYANTMEGGDQSGGSAIQYVSKSSTKLAVDLWFDVAAAPPLPTGPVRDVRELTNKVNHFFTPVGEPGAKAPPPVRFSWGSFLFEGVMDSMTESIELFSADGRPLRSKVSLSITSQDIQSRIDLPENGAPSSATRPQVPAAEGEGLQQLLGRSGDPEAWQSVARGNGVENPRRLPAGSFIDPSARS